MKKFAMLAVFAAVCGGVRAEDAPKPVAPQKQHGWLTQLAGEWETEAEMVAAPGQPAVKCKGTETVRTLGGLWIVSEHKGEFMGTPVNGQMTVGYDAKSKKYVGTWVCSACDHLWKYEGTVDESGKVLTLETEGPNPALGGKTSKMRDVMELKDKDTRILKSSILADDGQWVPFMTMTATRKK